MNNIMKNRKFMQCPAFGGIMEASDQKKGVAQPTYERVTTGNFVKLEAFDELVKDASYLHLLATRRSVRIYEDVALTSAQLAFLLWSASGIHEYRGNGVATFRPVPSGGARHPFDLYMIVKDVENLKPGIYRYSPTQNVGTLQVSVEYLAPLFADYETKLSSMLAGQKWANTAQVVIFASCVPYRAEWRYHEAAHRVMLIDLGHIGQNLMLSATALGLGSCCIAAFDQKICDEVFNFDGDNEFTAYALPIGNPKTRR